MSVSTFSKAAGGAVERVTATVTPTGGVFTLDLDSADDFILNGFDSQFVSGTPARLLPTFIGAQTVTRSGSTTSAQITYNFALDINATEVAPGPGDLVIIHASIGGSTTNVVPVPSDFVKDSSGVNYTVLDESGANDTNSIESAIFYKVMGATPDTSFRVQQNNGNSANSTAVTVAVFRNFDLAIFDTTVVNASVTNTALVTPGDRTTNTENSLGVVFVAAGTDSTEYLTASQDPAYTNRVSVRANDTNDASHFFATINNFNTPAGTVIDPPPVIPSVVATSECAVSFSFVLKSYETTNPVPLPATIEYTGSPVSGSTYNVAILNDLEITLDPGGYWENTIAPNVALDWDTGFSSGPALAINNQYALTSFTAIAGALAERSFSAPKTLKTRQITSTQIWTAPADVTEIELILCGGGGGGSAGGGGGSVFYSPYIAVDPGASYLVTIGAGGVGGATPTNGSASSFSNLFTATGGFSPSSSNIAGGGKQAGLGGSGGNAGGDATAVNGNSMAGAPGAFNFGGGGGGGTTTNARAGQASNGGGQGERAVGNHGLANTGGGGGGVNGTVTSYGNGGSGIAIIKYWSSL